MLAFTPVRSIDSHSEKRLEGERIRTLDFDIALVSRSCVISTLEWKKGLNARREHRAGFHACVIFSLLRLRRLSSKTITRGLVSITPADQHRLTVWPGSAGGLVDDNH